MTDVFSQLSADQIQLLKDAHALIAILIGKADNDLDLKELELAKKIVHVRTFNTPDYLNAFYEDVETGFDGSISSFSNELPADTASRNAEIASRLAKLNEVLPKLEPRLAYLMYKGYTRFAAEIAKASGGFLGFMSVNSEESKWIHLPMITPIPEVEDEEE
jgi:predicted nucleic acid-binding protein